MSKKTSKPSEGLQTPKSPSSSPVRNNEEPVEDIIYALNDTSMDIPDPPTKRATPVTGDKSRLSRAMIHLTRELFEDLRTCIEERLEAGESGLTWDGSIRTSIDWNTKHLETRPRAFFNAMVLLVENYTMAFLGGKTIGVVLRPGQYLFWTFSRDAFDKQRERHEDVADLLDELCKEHWPERQV